MKIPSAIALVLLASCTRTQNEPTRAVVVVGTVSARPVPSAPPTPRPPRWCVGLQTREGWCWTNPLPIGEQIMAMTGTSVNDAWAVGANGTIARWDGSRWLLEPSGTHELLYDVTRANDGTMFTVGGRVVLRRESSGWKSVPDLPQAVRSAAAIWAASANDVWIAGFYDTIAHFDGKSWSTFGSARSLRWDAIRGVDANDIWAAGTGGSIDHWDGRAWTAQTSGVTWDIRGLYARAHDDVWAYGAGGVAHYDGRAWKERLATNEPVVGLVPGRVMAAALGSGAVFDLSTKAQIAGTRSEHIAHVWGAGGEAWGFGDIGALYSWDGTSWSDRWAGTQRSLYAVAATSKGAWVVGMGGFVMRADGDAWRGISMGTGSSLSAIWSPDHSDAWAVGAVGTILHCTTSGCVEEAEGVTPAPLHGIWGTTSDDLWAVGEAGEILRRVRGTWSRVISPTHAALLAVWGASPNDVWAVGEVVLHFDGASWSEVALPLGRGLLSSISGASAREVYAVGRDSSNACLAVRFDGSKWRGLPPCNLQGPLESVYAAGPNDVWAAGPRVIHFDGTSWKTADAGGSTLHSISGAGGTTWVVGEFGAALRR